MASSSSRYPTTTAFDSHDTMLRAIQEESPRYPTIAINPLIYGPKRVPDIVAKMAQLREYRAGPYFERVEESKKRIEKDHADNMKLLGDTIAMLEAVKTQQQQSTLSDPTPVPSKRIDKTIFK